MLEKETKLSKASAHSNGLKTSVPIEFVHILKLEAEGKLKWRLKTKNDIPIVTVEKVE